LSGLRHDIPGTVGASIAPGEAAETGHLLSPLRRRGLQSLRRACAVPPPADRPRPQTLIRAPAGGAVAAQATEIRDSPEPRGAEGAARARSFSIGASRTAHKI
jgi:hypothetical protein